jgi:hypothetical protein
MDYPIPTTPEEIVALQQEQVDAETIAVAIAGVVHVARAQGQTLEDLTAEVLMDDPLLEQGDRRWLSQMVSHAWSALAVNGNVSEQEPSEI